jgi:LacI family transcriptional regulator
MADNHPTVTLREIAQQAGYGLATVSYALRNLPKVRPDTRDKIRAVACRLGYRPNPLVATVMAHVRSANPPRHEGTIACLARWKEAAAELNPRANALFLRGARARAAALGWRIDDIPCDDRELKGARLTQILLNRGICGVLIGSLPSNRGELELEWSRFACATWGYSLHFPVLHRAVVHHGHGVALAFQKAREAGVRRIGLAAPAHSNARSDFFYEAAYYMQQKSVNARDRLSPFLPAESGWTQRAFLQWLQRERPEVVITPCDIGVWLPPSKARTQSVGIITLDKIVGLAEGAGVDYCHEAVGSAVVDLILTQIHANERGVPDVPKVVLIEGRWCQGPIYRSRNQ